MKNIKFNKILILFVISVILISSVSVVCFADVGSGFLSSGDVLIFNDDLDSDLSPSDPLYVSFHVIDNNGEIHYFNSIWFSYRGYVVISYGHSTGVIDVYTGEWIDSFYQTIYIDSDVVLDSHWNAYLSLNTHSPVSNYYSEIYDIIIRSIYGDSPITSDMQLSASLVSTILSMLVVLAPVLFCAFLFIFILKRV